MDTKQRARLRARKQKLLKKNEKKNGHGAALGNRSKSTAPVENRRFNRIETNHNNYYHDSYGWATQKRKPCNGWIKCRLLHGPKHSLIVPDQLVLEYDGLKWIQPLAFTPSILGKLDEDQIVCDVNLDISCGHNIRVRFFNNDFVRSFPDGSQLFKCEILGPSNLYEYSTGDAEWGNENNLYLRLFHHTTADSCEKIKLSGHFRTSPYNIQGTTKHLQNVSYIYLTPLDRIATEGDLRCIAMAPEGIIQLRRDGFEAPALLMPGWEEAYKNDILQLAVYSCDSSKRDMSVETWVDSATLAPQHIYRHDEGAAVYYELPHAFIHRIGAEPKGNVLFDNRNRIHQQAGLKTFDYVVVGDCTTIAGLRAPYDEEDTTHIMKIERIPADLTMLDFWFLHSNQDLYSGKDVELQKFHKNKAT
jgi:hypothetical protein